MDETRKYQYLLVDMDMTLMDFERSERLSVGQVLRAYGVEPDTKLECRYHAINQELWGEFENGNIDKETILRLRFDRLFREIGKKVDGVEANKIYCCYLRESAVLLPDAKEICEYLASRYSMYIVTNGWADTQYRRLELSGLAPYFKGVFVSEEAKSQKPHKDFFDYCFRCIGNVDRRQVLIIGDSLGSDIRGGNNAGIDTCWINPEKLPKPSGMRIDYEIQSLNQLWKIL